MRYLPACGVMVVLRTFTFDKVPFSFGGAQQDYHACTGTEFPRGTSFWVYHEPLHPYVKSTRGSNARN